MESGPLNGTFHLSAAGSKSTPNTQPSYGHRPMTGPSSATAAKPSTPCACGERRPTKLQFRRILPRRFLRRRSRERRGRVAHPGFVPDESTPRGKACVFCRSISWSPARCKTSSRGSAAGQRLALPSRQGRHPAQRHPPGLAVAELMRILLDRPSWTGTMLAPDRPHPRLHQPYPVARGAGTWPVALFERSAAAPADHLRDQSPLP